MSEKIKLTRALFSAIILTQDEEVNISDCLASLNGLRCDVFVVDSGSSDRTVEIARKAGAKTVDHPFENYATQRNWAQHHLPIETDWVLHLDADERLTPELVEEINDKLGQPDDQVDGFLFRKRTVFMGRWMRHGGHYPSYHLRLYRKDKGRCEDRLYDQHFVVDGKVETLENDYIDMLTPDLRMWTRRHVRWAELEAKELVSASKGLHRVHPSFFGNPIQRRRWLREGLYAKSPLFFRVFGYWFYRYFIRLGFLDGKEGLIFHFLQGFWFRFLVDALIFERRRCRRDRRPRTAERSKNHI